MSKAQLVITAVVLEGRSKTTTAVPVRPLRRGCRDRGTGTTNITSPLAGAGG
jgi:hypothetical protein